MVATRLNHSRRLKRAIDLAGAGIGIATLSPLLLTIFLLQRVFHGSPAIFVQERPGYRGQIFRMMKFRSMRHATSPSGELLPDAERLTAFGQLLRKTSLDELPELFNVLRGEMSLVGPRPLLVEYLPLYSSDEARRHDVLPGITGWAQVNGRNAIGWSEKFELDVWYVDHWSNLLDLRILGLTVLQVLRREGIQHAGEATMSKFRGSKGD